MTNVAGNQSVDDLIMTVVGMGFSLEDAQEAVSAGKLRPDEMIDWILAGKPPAPPPRAGTATGTLRLGPPTASSGSDVSTGLGFSQPPLHVPMDTTPPPPPQATGGHQDTGIVSRTHLNDEQRKVKDNFEEKQRQESQRLAKQERQAQKKAKDQILQQIKEDRETAKLKRSAGSAVQGSSSGQKVGGENSPEKSENKGDKSLLQIRLPDGRALRETFASTAVLNEVWTFIQKKVPTISDMAIIQPFPRKEFTKDDMETSLSELGLVPTGSLALKKKEKTEASSPPPPPPEEKTEEETECAEGNMETEESPPLPCVIPPHPPIPGGNHQWGSGNVLHPEDQEVDAMGSDGEEEVEEEIGENQPVDPALLPWPGMAGGGGGGMGGGGGNMPGHDWGFGNQLVGEVPQAANLPHHRQDARQLAVEAARQRYGRNPPAQVERKAEEAAGSHGAQQSTVPSLTRLLTAHVCRRLCDSRHPIVGLHCLPADLATNVLSYLILERLLKPRTLQPFVTCRLRKLILDYYPYTTNELLNAIRLHTYVTHLSLCSCPLITDKGLDPLRALKRMKVLSVGSCPQISDNSIPVIKDFPALITLILEGTGVTDAGIQELCTASPPPCLQHLDLSRTAVTHNVLMQLHNVPNLHRLSMEGCENVSSLSGIEGLPVLSTLNVAATSLSTDSMMCLARLQSLTALNIANIAGMDGDTALRHIAGLQLQLLQLPNRLTTTDRGMQYLTGMPLVTLDLTNYINVGNVGMEAVGQIHTLQRLRLSNTKVGDAGLIFLEGLKNLEELLLDRTSTTNQGAVVFKAFTNLQELSLAETSITNGFLKSGCLSNCVMLSKLNLAKTVITDKGIRHLQLPYLTLLNIDGTHIRQSTAEALCGGACPRLQSVTWRQLKSPLNTEDEEED